MPRAALWLLLILVTTGGEVGAEGHSQIVRRVEVTSDGRLGRDVVVKLLGLEQGAPLDRARLRQGTLALYAGGEVEHLAVEAVEVADGLDVTVVVREVTRLSEVVVLGVRGRWKGRVRSWLELEVGQPVSASRVEAAVRRVERQLRERGFARAGIDTSLLFDRPTNSARVVLTVRLADPLRVVSVVVEGVEDPAGEVAAAAGVRPGALLTDKLVERVRRRVEDELRERGHWEAAVLGVERREIGDEVVLAVRADAGPRYELEVVAPPERDKLVKAVVPDPSEEPIAPAQTGALGEQIREALQLKGYLLARCEVSLDSDAEAPVLRVELAPGRQLRVHEVEFGGGHGLSAEELESAVRVRRGRVGGWRGQKLSQATLDVDRRSLEDAYRRKGFAAVEVGPPQIEPSGPDGVRVVFPIDEGQQWLLADLRLEDFPVEVAAAVEKMHVREGGPWNPRVLEADRRRLEVDLANAGYPDARVVAEVDTSEAGRARLRLRAEPGEYVRIGIVMIAGLERTRRSVVERTLEQVGLVQGAPLTQESLLRAQQRLYELGLFQHVELVPIPGQEHGNERGLVVRCEEGLQRSYLLGAGWDTEGGARFILGWSHLNLFGGAHAVSFETRLSQREQRYQLGLREARLPSLGEPGYVVAYRTEEEFASFSQLRRGLWFEIGDRRRRPWRPWLRYEYQIQQPDAPREILSELERREQEIRVASLTPTLEWDTRDDPLAPSEGAFAALSAEYAFQVFQADAQFLKLQSGLSLYRPLPGGSGAAGLRLGYIRPIGVVGDEPANLQVPIGVRFFAGGRVSHRAFATDRLGIVGQTLDESLDPIGGNAMALLNLEYRLRLGSGLSGVLFVDGGNVWAEPALVRVDDLRWGLGAGLRYDTPAGPLRLEYGYKLDRLAGESSGELFLSFGEAF